LGSDKDSSDTRRAEIEFQTELSNKQKEIEHLRRRLTATQELLIKKESQLNKITSTLGWQLLERFGPVKYRLVLPAYRRVRSLFKARPGSEADTEATYEKWARRSEEFRYNPERAAREIEQLRYKPVISIALPAPGAQEEDLNAAIDSVLGQYYLNWELCITVDGSTTRSARKLIEERAARDPRIKVVFSESDCDSLQAMNLALKVATGEFIGLLYSDVRLTPDAFYEAALTLQSTDADLIYSDEDRVDITGRRREPFFKPAWSPDLLLSFMYIGRFAVYRKELIDRIGGLREGSDGAHDYDLALRFTEQTDKIAHVPRILYHETKARVSSPNLKASQRSAKKALTDALGRRGIEGRAEAETGYDCYSVRRTVSHDSKVTIIIPTRDRLDLLRRCIHSVESKTDYKNYEIIIIDNDSRKAATLHYLKRTPHRVIRCPGPFNYSRLNNTAARQAEGDFLLLLNNDTEVIAGEWLSALVEHAERPEVGAVGAKLLYPGGKVQHAGVILGIGGVADHVHKHVDGARGAGYSNFPDVIRNYSAVTAACLMIRRELFEKMRGFNEADLAIAFNDVDLCLRLRQQGYLIVYTPRALLYHYESATRRSRVRDSEASYLISRWHGELACDPYYNPSLSLAEADFSVDFAKPESFYCIDSHDVSDKTVGEVGPGRCIGQEFFAAQDNLCAISLKFGKARNLSGIIVFHLRESHVSDSDLATVEADASRIQADDWFLFSFDPLRGSGGKWFYFFIEIKSDSQDSILGVRGTSFTGDALGASLVNHQPEDGTLAFRAYCLKQFR
jgi:O-antigen biosynthesis protein